MSPTAEPTYEEWERIGRRNNWIGAAVCLIHDGYPTTEAEDHAFDDGEDPCIHVHRLYENEQVRLEVESNHSPSIWRKPL